MQGSNHGQLEVAPNFRHWWKCSSAVRHSIETPAIGRGLNGHCNEIRAGGHRVACLGSSEKTKSASGYRAVSIKRCAPRRSRNYLLWNRVRWKTGLRSRVVPPRLDRAACRTAACRDLRRGTLSTKRRGCAPGITFPRQLPRPTVFHVKQPPSADSANMWSTLPLGRTPGRPRCTQGVYPADRTSCTACATGASAMPLQA